MIMKLRTFNEKFYVIIVEVLRQDSIPVYIHCNCTQWIPTLSKWKYQIFPKLIISDNCILR